MTSDEIRASYLEYFRKRGHTVVPSASLIPADDPTLLFTNAGMNQFKDVFLGIGQREYTRAVDTQKCLRVSGKHNDLEEVGHSPSHHTFFEMLGNWSFGDYYKQEAIAFAWELVTELWKIPAELLWATVYVEDDETEKLWLQETDLPLDRIRRCNKDNFWEMGETGPCGPCSELFIDLGVEAFPETANDPDAGPNTSDRFLEFWNLVFIQFNRDQNGKLDPLPATHVDTGMGFERITSILQGVDSNYKTDLFTPLLDTISDMTETVYSHDISGLPHRVIADHIRCLTFAIGDGVMPSNDGRGYVIRRILRRAVLYGKKLDMDEPFIFRLVDKVVELLGDVFPDVLPRREFITRTIQAEENRFHQTLARGLEMLGQSINTLKAEGETELDGKRAFELYDTFGFPLDLTQLLTREEGFAVDEIGFEDSMEEQRARGRAAWQEAGSGTKDDEIAVYAEVLKETGSTEFVGYTEHTVDAEIVALIAGTESVARAKQDQEVSVLLNRTPFYGESGGQVGDVGVLESSDAKLAVLDTIKPSPDLFVHKCKVVEGEITPFTKVKAQIDIDRRNAIAVSHTATHLLHSGLRNILGTHVAQAGSLVQAGRLRFDFNHYEAVSSEQLRGIEIFVNEKIRENDILEIGEMSLDKAKERGALAFFGDKYGDVVRVVKAGKYSVELCGGTHVDATGELGYVKLMSESSIAAGVRRVEALTGNAAVTAIQDDEALLSDVASLLKTPKTGLSERIEQLLLEQRELEQQIQQLKSQNALSNIGTLVDGATLVEGVKVVASRIDKTDRDSLRQMVDALKNQLESGVVALASVTGDDAAFIVGVTSDLVKDQGLHAGKLIQAITEIADGRGGGRPELAQGGGRNLGKVDAAIAATTQIIEKQLQT
ncbi:MAG: alanine--tRNA ligase [Candidatus Poribacteria bacterium]|nr:alanine--tRNA ligase [Candidatus Poribacteria bacterium]